MPTAKPIRLPRRLRSKMPAAKHEAAGMPDPHAERYEPHTITTAGTWLVLSDIHCPYHDRVTIELAMKEARQRNAVGVILNGDTMDSHEVSRHDKDPSAPRYVEEVNVTRKLLAYIRGQLPKAQMVLKEGNHEERLASYIINRAPALFGLEGIDIPGLLHLADLGAEWVTGRRVVALGKLNVIHGHEFPGGCTSPVNPARGLYLKARSVAMCGHHHQTSEHHTRNIRARPEAEKFPDVVKDLEARLVNYAKQQRMSEWLKSQVDYLGFQGETFLDPGYSTDGGLPHEKPALPKK